MNLNTRNKFRKQFNNTVLVYKVNVYKFAIILNKNIAMESCWSAECQDDVVMILQSTKCYELRQQHSTQSAARDVASQLGAAHTAQST